MVINMKLTLKKVFIVLTILFISILTSSQVFAEDMTVKVNCDGKTIKMTSETPDLTWRVEDILPGETDESTVTIQNIGKKKVDIDLNAKVESGEELTKILDLQIIKTQSSKEETVYTGKYSDLKTINVSLEPHEKMAYKFIATLPIETGNEFQGKESVIKFVLIATGKKDEPVAPDETPEIITDEVVPPQTGEGIIIFIIGGVLLIALIVFLVTIFLNRKDKNK